MTRTIYILAIAAIALPSRVWAGDDEVAPPLAPATIQDRLEALEKRVEEQAAAVAAQQAELDRRAKQLADLKAATETAATASVPASTPKEPPFRLYGFICLQDAGACPVGWGCLDLSVFAPGLPAVCTKP